MAKKTYTSTIDEDLIVEFRKKCKTNGMEQSFLISSFMRSFVADEIGIKLVNQKAHAEVKES